MSTVYLSSPNRDTGRKAGNEPSDISQGAASATPRDNLEFGAKLLGYSGEVGGSAVPDQLAASAPLRHAGQAASTPPISASANRLDIYYVSRGAKSSIWSPEANEILPPRDSVELQQPVARRIGYISAAFALTLTATLLIRIIRGFLRAGSDWVIGMVSALLILSVSCGVWLLVRTVYGMFSGGTKRAKKGMDQVRTPSEKRK